MGNSDIRNAAGDPSEGETYTNTTKEFARIWNFTLTRPDYGVS